MKLPPYPKYKSSSVEWFGEMPDHWAVKRLKLAARLTDMKVEADEDNPVPYIGLENIESWTGHLLAIDLDVVPTGTASAFKAGNTLFGKLRPYLAKACNPDFGGLCSTELLVLDGADIGRRALLYTVLTDGFIKLVDSSTYGSKMPRASWDFIGNCTIPVSPPDEQLTIADFLDAETAKLDTLVAKKRELIEKLKEKRSALISRTVTRGLPPEAARAAGLDPNPKLKPSGIEWLGEIPEHWRVTRLKYATSKIIDCPHETPIYSPDGDYLVIRTADLTLGVMNLSNAYRLDEDEYRKRTRREPVLEGDIVYGREGERWGFAAQVPSSPTVCLGQRMMQFRVGKRWDNRFLMWELNSKAVYQQGAVDTLGATSPHVNVETICNYWLAEPPFNEQRAIADYLDRETNRIDRMVAKIEEAIERLLEYRTALITAAVTGKIDVRSYARGTEAA